MALRFASLGSGSEGNGLLVEARCGLQLTRVLVDCGFGIKDALARMQRQGVDTLQTAAPIDAILVTHEHSDHASGVFKLARKLGVPVYLTHGTYQACMRHCQDQQAIEVIAPGASFSCGALSIQPFAVPHDAREPVQYTFTDGANKLGLLTDSGCVTQHMVQMLDACDAMVLEFNHDAQMLANSSYPPSLRARIAGRWGHLENQASLELLARVDRSRLQHVVAAHLSQQNNRPDLVASLLSQALDGFETAIHVASQDLGCDWVSL